MGEFHDIRVEVFQALRKPYGDFTGIDSEPLGADGKNIDGLFFAREHHIAEVFGLEAFA